ncbi:MAG: nicotinate-nucleotide diphosphorylase (carboxylating), partial [Ruminiclostridium sp.]|nr:nicotinate-nucleotide diphosphorylase (carboxylating) [Ruminiclostridium sp.]
MKLPQFYIDELIKTALNEDINYIDSTTDLLIPDDDVSEAYYLAKDSGVLAGTEIAARVFELLDKNIEVKFLFKDGDRVQKGDIVAEFKGSTSALLKGERTALNLIQHASGIATYT